MSLPDFKNEPLGDMVAVGLARADAVRLWMRSQRPGRLKVSWWPEDDPAHRGEATVEVPADNARDNTCDLVLPAGQAALRPLQRYRFRVVHTADEALLGEGRFETAPGTPEETPSRFAIALMSCHQPFDPDGSVAEDTPQMLRAVRACLEKHDAKLTLYLGDQIYSDLPARLSLLHDAHFATVAPPGRTRLEDCTVEEVRRLYHRRYRYFWGLPELKTLQSHFATYPILDDHDIVDNWGSDPKHQKDGWPAVGKGARWAYHDYQAARVIPHGGELPASFHYQVDYGHTAVFFMDLRSEREADESGQLYSDAQEADLRAFLEQNKARKVLLLVLSVPVVHLPRALAEVAARATPDGEDFSDRWSSLSHVKDRDRFLEILHAHQVAHPEQRIVLVSGDIHVGCVHRLHWSEPAPDLFQIVSSGLTNKASWPVRIGAKLLIGLNRKVATLDGELHAKVKLVKGEEGGKNPYGRLNMGVIEVETPAPDAAAKLRFYLYGHDEGEPVCVYRSPLL